MNQLKFYLAIVLCLFCESYIHAQQMILNQQGEIFIIINNDHRPTDEKGIIINNDHRPTDEKGIIINNDHRLADEKGIIINNDHRPTDEKGIIINNDHRIVKMNASGQELATWKIEGAVQDMATGPNGNLYVLLQNEPIILNYSRRGDLLQKIPLQKAASSIIIDREETILLNINNSRRVVRLNLKGEYIGNWKY